METIPILSDSKSVRSYLADLRRRGIGTLALDLEADQGSYRYRYSVSIFQCFDGRDGVVIDVLALGPELDALRELLEAPDIVKLMFSCKNDLFIVQNVLDCGISPLRDIAVAQKLLGRKVNLSDRLGIGKADKDRFQRANWLKRPLSPALLAYAVADVAHLAEMEAELLDRLAERRLSERYREACAALPRADYRVDQRRQYEKKFPGFHRLSPDKKELARLVWVFRELVGEHFDCPVGYLLSTKALPDLVADGPDPLAERLERALNRDRRPERRLGTDFVAEKLRAARDSLSATAAPPSRRHEPGRPSLEGGARQ